MDAYAWLLALVAAFCTGLGKSGFASGLGTFAAPLLAASMPLPQAAAMLLPLLLLLDVVSVLLWRHQPARVLWQPWLWPGVLGAVAGALLLGRLPAAYLSLLVAALCGLLLALGSRGKAWPRLAQHGPAMAALSGFASMLCHAGGPPLTLHCLARGLAPAPMASACTVFFCLLNLLKLPVYAQLDALGGQQWLWALALCPAGLAGVVAGVKLTGRLSPRGFYRASHLAVLLACAVLLHDGWRQLAG